MRFSFTTLRSLIAALAALSLSANLASAQFSNSQTRNTTGSSQRSSGFGSLGGGGVGGGATPGTQGLGNQNVFGQTGFGQSLLNQQSAFGFQASQNQNGFLGGRGSSQNFIGNNQRAATTNNQQQNPFGNRNSRGQRNQFDLNDLNNLNQQNQSQNQDSRRAIRPQQKIAFEVPERTTEEISATMSARFDQVTQQPALRGVTIELEDAGVVVLRGEVATASQRLLAANMMRLEPGVKKVRNELTLALPAEKK